jgi:hypothetical protein
MLNFELKLEEANLILAALAKAPYEQVAGLIANMQQQAQPQLPALEAAAKAEAASKAEAPEAMQ